MLYRRGTAQNSSSEVAICDAVLDLYLVWLCVTCLYSLPGVLVAVWVVLLDVLQEAFQQGQFSSATAGGGGGAGASGGRPDRIQVSETGQVLRRDGGCHLCAINPDWTAQVVRFRCTNNFSVRCLYLVQVAVEDSAVSTVTLPGGLTPGRTRLRLRPHPVRQGGRKKPLISNQHSVFKVRRKTHLKKCPQSFINT